MYKIASVLKNDTELLVFLTLLHFTLYPEWMLHKTVKINQNIRKLLYLSTVANSQNVKAFLWVIFKISDKSIKLHCYRK